MRTASIALLMMLTGLAGPLVGQSQHSTLPGRSGPPPGLLAPADIHSPADLAARLQLDLSVMAHAGQMAEQRGSTPAVRRFGQRLRLDSQVAERRLRSRAKAQGLQLPVTAPNAAASPQAAASPASNQAANHPETGQQANQGEGGVSASPTHGPGSEVATVMADIQHLSALSGTAFDRQFLLAMQSQSQMLMATLTAAETVDSHTKLEPLLRQMAPVQRVHLRLAQALLGQPSGTL